MIRIIDVSSYIWAGMGTSFGAKASYRGIPTGGIYGLLQQIAIALKEKDHPILVYDMPTNAREILPEYKGSRVRNPKIKFQQELVKKYIEPAIPNNFRIAGMEADWVAFNIMEKYRGKIKTNISLRTTDYDWCHNIVLPNEYMMPAVNGYRSVQTSTFEDAFSGFNPDTGERYQVTLNSISAKKVFMGDKSDNIKPINRIGSMSEIKLFNMFMGYANSQNEDPRELDTMLMFLDKFSGLLGDQSTYLSNRARIIYPRKMEDTSNLELFLGEIDRNKLTTVCSITGCKSIANRLGINFYDDMGSAQEEVYSWYKNNFESNKTQMFEEPINLQNTKEPEIQDRGGFIL